MRITMRQINAFFGTEINLQLRRRGNVATNMGPRRHLRQRCAGPA